MEEKTIEQLQEEYLNLVESQRALEMKMLEKIMEQSNKIKKVEVPINYKSLPYTDRGALYGKYFGLGFLGNKIDDKLILISLICSFVLAARKKDPTITVLDCVKKLTDYETLSFQERAYGEGNFYENLAIVCEDFIYGIDTGNTFGLKNAVELKAKVKEILHNRVPF